MKWIIKSVFIMLFSFTLYAKEPYVLLLNTPNEERISLTIDEILYIYKGVMNRLPNGGRISKIFIVSYSDVDQKKMVVNLLGISLTTFKRITRNNKKVYVVKPSEIYNKLKTTKNSIGMVYEDRFYLLTKDDVLVEIKIIE